MSDVLLEIRGLITEFETDEGRVRAVDQISFTANAGETLGIVGESGCGKSVTALSIMRLLPQPMGQIVGGSILFQGQDLTEVPLSTMEQIRGSRIGMVFQEPMTALNPVHTIGKQLTEVLLLHKDIRTDQAIREAIEILDRVGIPSPDVRMTEYPHQLSGGMRQRVVIAIALACKPALLIADEPTTALDVTIQAQILALIKELQTEMGMSVILITHDLGVVAETCQQAVVMYCGRIVERSSIEALFASPRHPYTAGLLASIPRVTDERQEVLPVIPGMVPDLLHLPQGCAFAERCSRVRDRCRQKSPRLELLQSTQTSVACYEPNA